MPIPVLVLTVANHGLNAGDQIFIEGVNGFNNSLNNQMFIVISIADANTFSIQANVSFNYQTGGRIHKFISTAEGPSYLNDQDVTVVTNGKDVIILPYKNGVVFPTPVWNAVIGLPYQWTLKFLPLGGDGQTVNQGKKRKLYDIVLRVWQSLGGFFGNDANNLKPLPYTNPDNKLNQNIYPDFNPLGTGDIHGVGIDSQWDDYCMPVLTGSDPLPFMLLAAILRSEIAEGK